MDTKVTLTNPWTKAPAKEMTLKEIDQWAEQNVHPQDRRNWKREAHKAFKANDGDTLGNMIIGS